MSTRPAATETPCLTTQTCTSGTIPAMHIGHTTGPVPQLAAPPDVDVPEAFRLPGPLTITVNITDFEDKFAEVYRLIHDLDRSMYPKRHRHCRTCHPEMDVRPLAINGQDYHCRQMARQKRKRR